MNKADLAAYFLGADTVFGQHGEFTPGRVAQAVKDFIVKTANQQSDIAYAESGLVGDYPKLKNSDNIVAHSLVVEDPGYQAACRPLIAASPSCSPRIKDRDIP